MFVSCEHNSISLINGPPLLPASIERKRAYLKGLNKSNIPFREEYIVNTDLTAEGNEAAISQLLALSQRPSAVVSFNDYVALDVMKVVRERGVTLNQDIHFISYANSPLWTYMENPPMAFIEQFPGTQGKKAEELLFDLIAAVEQQERKRGW